jgi:hypothetical protein
MFDEADRSLRILRSRMGAYRLHATHDARETTKAAREAFANKFEHEVDPDGVLSPVERARRAKMARKAYFTRLSYLSAKARRDAKRRRRGRPTS